MQRDESRSTSGGMVIDVRALWNCGLSLIPCHRGTGTEKDKTPLVRWEAYQHKRPTLAQVRAWEDQFGSPNWAILTGAVSGVVVLDIDSEAGELEAQRRGLPTTVSALTAHGRHIYFRHLGGTLPNWSKRIPGVDFRGDGGYVMAPGSVHPTGALYSWENSIEDVELADPPEWLLELCRAPQPATVTTAVPATLPAVISPEVRAYAEVAAARELSALEQAQEGQRNSALNECAFTLAQFVGAGALDQSWLEGELLTRAMRLGLEPEEAAKTIRSGITAGKASPRDLSGVGTGWMAPTNGEAKSKAFAHTDTGNAERLVYHHGRDLKYIDAWGKWLTWDGVHWLKDETREVYRRAKDTARNIYLEAHQTEDAALRKKIAAHARASEGSARIKAMITLATSELDVAIRHTDLDTDPMRFTVLNGTLNLESGELMAPERSDLITKQAPVIFDPSARCPLWMEFLRQIMGDNEGLILFLQKACGYALTGSVIEQCFFFLYGSGSNGKSTFLDVLLHIMGDYGLQAPPALLVAKHGESHPTELTTLFGRRFMICHEIDQGKKLAEGTVKQITGGDMISARGMGQDFWTFPPTHKIFLAANHKPKIRGVDHGMWRRIRLVPFTVTIPEERKDRLLTEKLIRERSGILNWLLEGCMLWQTEGLGTTPEIQLATEQYKSEQDELGGWLAERCVVGEGEALVSALYADYASFQDEQGEAALSKKAFGLALEDRGFKAKATKTARYRTGLRLADELRLEITGDG